MLWFKPPILARCSSGTIREVDACMAGQWKPCSAERAARTAKTCHISTAPVRNESIRTAVAAAVRPSAANITRLRPIRSTMAPANGTMRMCGITPTMVAVSSMMGSRVSMVSHHTRENWTSAEPIRDTA